MPKLGKYEYEIHEQLGTGSMGNVYRARDTVLQRAVALKTIKTGADIETEMRERFYREARACGRLQHPNIVTIYDLGEQDRTAYIAMELLDGEDFRKVIEERRVVSLSDKLELMIRVCEALGHAHRHGVIHRDIKPSNVFLTWSKCIKVLDFGIARLPSSRLTVAGNVLGTPNYMAPEQILAKPCDGRTDLFSAGVVFFEFVTGQHPFRGSLIPQRIVETDPDSLFDYDSSLPVLLEKVFTRALAKEPDQRYGTGAAFASDLVTVLDALRQNGSPTFSRITLPSEREASASSPPLSLKPSLTPMRAPEGEDSAEWRYSEVLGLIPLFEEALEHNNASEARRYFESLERVTAGDERFNEAVSGCRARLEKISPAPEPTPNPRPKSTRICIQCGASNRLAARFCIQCGADLDDEEEQHALAPSEPPSLEQKPIISDDVASQNGLDTIFDGTIVIPQRDLAIPPLISEPSSPSPDVVAKEASFMRRAEKWTRTHPRTVVADIAALALIVAAMFALRHYFRASYPEEHPVATAKVIAPKLEVFETASPNPRLLYSAPRGKTVSILDVPVSHSQEWVRVQVVSDGEPQRPGFAHQAQLGDWKGLDATAARFICCVFESPATTDEEFEKRKFLLDELIARFPGSAEAATAATDKVRLRLESIKLHQSTGLAGEMLRNELNSAREDAVRAGESAHGVVVEIDEMLRTVFPDDQIKDKSAPETDISQMLIQARKNLDKGNLRLARYWIRSVLKIQADNRDALALNAQVKEMEADALKNGAQ